ncbi:MAG: GNAT family N-acetyltransferase [Burkholderiales bacterium]|nr:GNAT family N-acetyltransferase [Burkholderiales bacterium]MDE2299384.1 GNAT family N-acetyltransferase [Burkholderiales bacterium]MDE2628907.1 GNAT family N-acetyltransferase [Burkholderiales bacterium]
MTATTPSPTALNGPRVRLRPWTDADLAPFAAMNDDPEVMRHLSARLTRAQSDAYAWRIRAQFDAHGFGLWALEVPQLGFAGFVGLSAKVPFELPVPGTVAEPHEIGWRLARAAWGRGYATEAAALVLRHAFDVLELPQVVSFTATANLASQAVMQRIGLQRRGEFDHPRLAEGHPLRRHVLYAQDAPRTGARPS